MKIFLYHHMDRGGGGASFLGLKRKQTMQLVATPPPLSCNCHTKNLTLSKTYLNVSKFLSPRIEIHNVFVNTISYFWARLVEMMCFLFTLGVDIFC